MGSSNLVIYSYYSCYGGLFDQYFLFNKQKCFFQSVEALIALPSIDLLKQLKVKQTFSPDEPLFFTFGNSGLIKFWSGTTGRCLLIQEDKTYEKIATNSYSKDTEHQQVFLNAYFNETTRMFYANTIDHNIVAFNIKKLKLEKQVKLKFSFSNIFFLVFFF